jgi:CRP-like cAMP-binding protein
MEREEVPPGRAVVREGEHAKRFYVVLSGRATTSARSGWRCRCRARPRYAR